MRRMALVAAAAFLLLTAGCGKGVELGSSFDLAGTGSASTLGGSSALSPSRSPAVAPGTIAPGSSGAAGATGGTFCVDLARELTSVPSVLGDISTPERLPAALAAARQATAKILAEAPAAIRGDVATLVGVTNQAIADLSANPPNVQDASSLFSQPSFQIAANNVARYAAQHCGGFPQGPNPLTPGTS